MDAQFASQTLGLIGPVTIFLVFVLTMVVGCGNILLTIAAVPLDRVERIVTSIVCGIVLISIGYFILARVSLAIIFWPLFVVTGLFGLYRASQSLASTPKAHVDWILTGILSFATIIPSLLVIKSGVMTNQGLAFVGIHAHDTIWHIAFLNTFAGTVPPQNPVFSDTVLQNYHYFNDLFIYIAHQLTLVANVQLSLKIIPIFYTFLFATSTYLLVKNLTSNRFASYFASIAAVLTSNLYYLAPLFYPHALVTPSVFWVDEYTTRMLNSQLTLSYSIILVVLLFLLKKTNRGAAAFSLVIAVMTASLLGFKSYGAVLLLLSLGSFALYKYFRQRDLSMFPTLGFSVVLSAAYYAASTIAKQSLFDFNPLWLIRTMYEASDHLNTVDWELHREVYAAHNNIPRLVQLYVQGIFVFVFGNLGFRLIGIHAIFLRLDQSKRDIVLLLCAIALFGTLIPLFVTQRGIAWNTIQFFYYTIMSLTILSCLVIGALWNNYRIGAILVSIVLFVPLVPGVAYASVFYLSDSHATFVPQSVIDAASYLQKLPNGPILLDPAFSQTARVSALSGKPSYFADEISLTTTLVNFASRKSMQEQFFDPQTDAQTRLSLLNQTHVRYIFFAHDHLQTTNNQAFQTIYDNAGISIVKIY